MSRRAARGARRRIVILGGAGAMGRITARDLVRTGRGAIEVVVADRGVGAVRIPGVATVAVDVCDPASLARALDGAFATIASLPYRLNLAAMQGALAAGAHYVDLGGLFHVTRRQLELHDAFAARGVMAILGVGSAPGILNVLAVRCAERLDTVREVHCLVGAVDRTRFRETPLLGFGYSVDTLLDEYVLPSAVFRDGAFAMVPALDPGERVAVRFPAPIGRLHVDSTLHSEVATLPLSFADRGIREVTFRQGFEPEFMERLRFLVQLGLADPGTLALANGNGVSPRAVLLALIGRQPPARPIGRPARYEVLRTVVRGRRNGRALTVTADCHAGPDAGDGVGPDIDTGAPPSIAVQLMAGGEIAIRPGVWPVEQVVPPAPFMRELKRHGMRVTLRSRAGRAPL
jgi:saccharopine dehydrogenase-like NADP-dependent oxidoreductase